jgi:predicted nuclease of predicted toxin-antitoxin system
MRILANENFPGDAVDALRMQGHDVTWIRTEAPGSSDEDVLTLARAEDRIILTFDKDFGELAFHSKLAPPLGIILFRISAPSSEHVTKVAMAALNSRSDWEGHFAVIENDRIRMRPLQGLA